MYRVTEEFSACENGVDVQAYKVGEYESIPEKALSYGVSMGYVVESNSSDEKVVTPTDSDNLSSDSGSESKDSDLTVSDDAAKDASNQPVKPKSRAKSTTKK